MAEKLTGLALARAMKQEKLRRLNPSKARRRTRICRWHIINPWGIRSSPAKPASKVSPIAARNVARAIMKDRYTVTAHAVAMCPITARTRCHVAPSSLSGRAI